LREFPKPRRGKLFPWSQGSGYLHDCWKETIERADVRYLKMHALRHTAATMLVDAGLKPHQLQQMLHASLATTLKYYVGTDRKMMNEAARLIGAGRYAQVSK
jgi:integrase